MSSLNLSNYVSLNPWGFIKHEVEKNRSLKATSSELHIKDIPKEIILSIFGFLPLEALGRTARVCKNWNVLSADKILLDPLKYFPDLKILDEKVWEEHADLEALE